MSDITSTSTIFFLRFERIKKAQYLNNSRLIWPAKVIKSKLLICSYVYILLKENQEIEKCWLRYGYEEILQNSSYFYSRIFFGEIDPFSHVTW